MKIRSTLLGVVLLFGVAPAAQAADVDVKIIGGEEVASAPWVTGLYWDDHFGCSASVIAQRWVLTARHCVGELPTHVMIGNVNIGQGRRVNVDRGEVSPIGDAALLHLASNANTTFVQLASQDPRVGATNYIYGWGTYEVGEGKPVSPRLKRAAVTVTGPTRDAYDGRAVGSKWASGATGGTAGYGDSGGPQMSGNVQVGVCSTGDYVNVQYASVAANRSWIRQVSGV